MWVKKTYLPQRVCAGLVAIFTALVPLYPAAMAQGASFSSRKNVAIVGFQHGLYLEDEALVYQHIREQLQASDDVQVLDPSTVKAGMQRSMVRKQGASSKKIRQAYEYFIQGVESYRTLNLSKAVSELSQSVKHYRSGIASIQDNHYLLYAHLYLGMALYFEGKVKEGQKYILEMIKLDANRDSRTLPLRDFPPKIVEIHKKQTAALSRMAKGQVQVRSDPPSAKVMLDGMEVGETPMTISNIPLGKHYIAIDLPGHDLHKQVVDVKSGLLNLPVKLSPVKMFLAQSEIEQAKQRSQKESLKQMAREMSVDYFLLGQVSPQGENLELKYQSYDVMKDQFSLVYARDLGSKRNKMDKGISKTVSQWAQSVGISEGSNKRGGKDKNAVAFDDPPKQKKKIGKKLLWIGLGAVALGAGGYFAFGRGDPDLTANVLDVSNPLNN